MDQTINLDYLWNKFAAASQQTGYEFSVSCISQHPHCTPFALDEIVLNVDDFTIFMTSGSI